MTQERSRGSRRLRAARGYPLARFALAALLIVVVAAALRRGLPPISLDGPYTHEELPAAAALEAVVLTLLVIVLIRRSRVRSPNLVVTRFRDVLRSTLAALAVSVPPAYLLTRTVRIKSHARPLPLLSGRPGQPGRFHVAKPVTNGAQVAGTVVDVLLGVILLAVVIVGVIALVRYYLRQRERRPDITVGVLDDDAAASELRRALHHGWLALRELDDARGAIIACYLAMEQSLARAGTARAAAETPDELLSRAVSSGLVHGTAASRLTAVFYEARYSTKDLPESYRHTAEQALAELSDSLGEPVP